MRNGAITWIPIAALMASLAHAPPAPTRTAAAALAPAGTGQASILVYHRFGPAVSDSMTVRSSTFRWQLEYLKAHRHPVIPLRTLVASLREGSPSPAGAVAVTADDGHRSVFTEMLPLVREHRIPVTLFIYPSAISNASYAMTWEQLALLHRTGLFDIQSHTYWHPNFGAERRRLSPAAYHAFATMQLCRARTKLGEALGVNVDMIAWPFGIHDDDLVRIARDCGYVTGFTLERRFATAGQTEMALPRFLVTDAAVGTAFASMLPAPPP